MLDGYLDLLGVALDEDGATLGTDPRTRVTVLYVPEGVRLEDAYGGSVVLTRDQAAALWPAMLEMNDFALELN